MKEEEFKELLQKTIKESIEQNIKPLKEAEIYQCPNCNKTFSYYEWQGNNWRCPNTECRVEVEPPKPIVLVVKEEPKPPEAPAGAPAEGQEVKEVVEARKKIVDLEVKNQNLEKQLKECSEKHEKIVKMIEGIIPSPQVVYSHGQTGGFKRLVENIKKLKHEVENL